MGKSDLSLEKVFSHYHDSFGVPVSPKKSSQERGKLSKMKKRKLQLSMLSLRKLFSFNLRKMFRFSHLSEGSTINDVTCSKRVQYLLPSSHANNRCEDSGPFPFPQKWFWEIFGLLMELFQLTWLPISNKLYSLVVSVESEVVFKWRHAILYILPHPLSRFLVIRLVRWRHKILTSSSLWRIIFVKLIFSFQAKSIEIVWAKSRLSRWQRNQQVNPRQDQSVRLFKKWRICSSSNIWRRILGSSKSLENLES